VLHGRDLKSLASWWDFIIFASIIGGCVAFIGYPIYRDWKKQRAWKQCKSELEKIEAEKGKMLSEKYKQKHCPICLNDFPAAEEKNEEETEQQLRRRTKKDKEKVGEEEVEGGGSTAEGEGTTVEEKDDPNVRILRCGHKFCRACVGEWLKQHDHCPVCRMKASIPRPGEDEDHHGKQEGRTGTSTYDSSTTGTRAYGGRQYRGRVHSDLLLFELMMLRSRYPTYVTQPMVERWGDPNFDSRMTTDSAFTATRPVTTSSSSGGGGYRFGGGSSGGGGGAGGSW